jgi:hypothetical protein
MAKPSLMDGLAEPTTSESEDSGLDSGAAFEELRTRFLNGDPEQAKDAFQGLISLCDDDSSEGPAPKGGKPALMIHIGGGK